MKQIINPKLFSIIIFILSILVIVKIIWIAISLLFLPNSSEEISTKSKAKALYYRVRLTNDAAVIAPVVSQPVRKFVPKISSMKGIKLIGLYHSSDASVVTVEKSRKTTVLTKGDAIGGFALESVEQDSAIFTKNGKRFTLYLNNDKTLGKTATHSSSRKQPLRSHTPPSHKIVEEDGIKMIDRGLLTNYISNPEKIWKDIGISENKLNGKLNGFKINYVKKNSDFERLGLKRGDLLMAINAEKLDNLGAVMNFYNDIKNIDNLTLTVERNGKSEDIEYEIQ
jgi:general secretion pathway protein C